MCARFTVPYGPTDGVIQTLNRPAAPRGLAHAMIEVRNDFLSDAHGQDAWAGRLSAALARAVAH